MNQKKKIISITAAVVILGIAGYFTYEHLMYVDTDNAQVEAHTVLLASRVPGYLVKIEASEGDKVKKDQVLIQIDDRDYVSAQESAASEVLSLEARRKDAEKNYQRIRELYKQGVVSSQQNDATTANYNDIKAKYDSANSRLAQAKLNLEFTKIKAPSDGIIAKRSAEIGQLTAPGTPLLGFVSSESRWVTANLKETEIGHVRVGQKVDIDIDALDGKTFKGEVESISSATGATFTLLPPDNATGNFTKVVQRVPIKIKFTNLNPENLDEMQVGLSALVRVHVR